MIMRWAIMFQTDVKVNFFKLTSAIVFNTNFQTVMPICYF